MVQSSKTHHVITSLRRKGSIDSRVCVEIVEIVIRVAAAKYLQKLSSYVGANYILSPI